ncbi:MAG: hypothetical protein ACI92E_000358 [Oceanicoccus sp.]|jgi:hypothetical protein
MQTLNDFFLPIGKLLPAVALGLLVGCGSGGGSDNVLGTPSTGGGSSSGPQLGNGSGDDFVASVLASDLGTGSLEPSGSTLISVSIVDSNGALSIESTTISFSSSCVTQDLSAFDQSVVTTDTGTAEVTYFARGCEGSDTIIATAGDLSASITINVDPEVVSLGSGAGNDFTAEVLSLGIGSNVTLSAGGQTTVSVSIANQEGVLQTADINSPVDVTFTSGCVVEGLATFDNTTISTVTGGATVTFTDGGCGIAPNGSVDTISATALGLSASVALDIASDTVNQVQFVSVAPAEMFLAGTGGEETSVVTFRVEGQLGGPVVGAEVSFNLSTEIGGLSLPNTSAVTDNNGEVRVTVQAGTVPTSVRVIATEASSGISTISDGLTVATGITDSDNFSVVSTIINPECWSGVQGGTTEITALLGDVFNNNPPDGTAVQFVAEGGVVESSCTTVSGVCTVTWRCQPEFVEDGRIEILGYTIGAESFDDINTNGVFDDGDSFVPADNDLSEAFRDDNENGSFDDIQYFDFNVNGSHDSPDGKYTGPSCGGNTATACSGNSTLHVFDSVTIVQSVPAPTRIFGSEAVPASHPQTTFTSYYGGSTIFELPQGGTIDLAASGGSANLGIFVIGDSNLNSLPNGTTISVETDNGELVSGTNFTVLNTTRPYAFSVSVTGDDESSGGVLKISVTPPGYGTSVYSWNIND